MCVKRKPPRLVYHFQDEESLNSSRQNGVKRFLALERRFHYRRDTPFSPSGAGLCKREAERPAEGALWGKSVAVCCFNALLKPKMAEPDYHQL